jgi:hypothetical protein
MTDGPLPPDTNGQRLDPGELLPPGQEVIAVAGPWTVLSCVTAACTNCGALPADEDTGMTPHFASTSQAAQELTQNWGWSHTRRSDWPKDDELLCPECAAPPASAPAPHGKEPDPWLG